MPVGSVNSRPFILSWVGYQNPLCSQSPKDRNTEKKVCGIFPIGQKRPPQGPPRPGRWPLWKSAAGSGRALGVVDNWFSPQFRILAGFLPVHHFVDSGIRCPHQGLRNVRSPPAHRLSCGFTNGPDGVSTRMGRGSGPGAQVQLWLGFWMVACQAESANCVLLVNPARLHKHRQQIPVPHSWSGDAGMALGRFHWPGGGPP